MGEMLRRFKCSVVAVGTAALCIAANASAEMSRGAASRERPAESAFPAIDAIIDADLGEAPYSETGRCTASLERHRRYNAWAALAQRNAIATVGGPVVDRVILAARSACLSRLRSEIDALGGSVEFEQTAVGYVRAIAPPSKLEMLASSPWIDAALVVPGIDQVRDLMTPAANRRMQAVRASIPSGSSTELPPSILRNANNPYSGTFGDGAAAFRSRHPTWDGRGVTIAILDLGLPDPKAPQLQSARSLDGHIIPKIVGMMNTSDPRLGDFGTGWITVRPEPIVAAESSAVVGGRRYTLPSPGTYWFGIIDETSDALPHFEEADLNRDGNPPGASRQFAVLWDKQNNRVWVDVDQDESFANNRAVSGAPTQGDTQVFGGREGGTPFAIETNRQANAISVLLPFDHATMGASTAVGSHYFGGEAGGVAPGAAILAVRDGFSFVSPRGAVRTAIFPGFESLLAAAADPRVDVIMSYDSAPPHVLRDGRSALDIIERRVVAIYNKPIVRAALNNGPTLGSSLGDGGDGILTVGAFTSAGTWRANYGVDAPESVRTFSGRGPADDGGMGPSVIAPIGNLAADVSYPLTGWVRDAPMPYRLPRGYVRGSGTSQAAPAAAGAIALLISAARQTHTPFDARRLVLAMIGSARALPGFGAHEQGAGAYDVERAWDILRTMPSDLPRIESRSTVRRAFGPFTPKLNEGSGFFEREGWKPGDRGRRYVILLRKSGPAGSIRYRLSWSSNDGTFVAPGSVVLPLRRPVRLPIDIYAGTNGVHSALLRVVDPESSTTIHQVLTTVVAADDVPPSGQLQFVGQLGRMSTRSYFFRMKRGARTLNVVARSASLPFAIGLAPPTQLDVTPSDRQSECDQTRLGDGRSLRCQLGRPQAGVWEFFIDYPARYGPEPMPSTIASAIVNVDFRIR